MVATGQNARKSASYRSSNITAWRALSGKLAAFWCNWHVSALNRKSAPVDSTEQEWLGSGVHDPRRRAHSTRLARRNVGRLPRREAAVADGLVALLRRGIQNEDESVGNALSRDRRAEATAADEAARCCPRGGAPIAGVCWLMKALRILALIAVGASCHLDKLLNGGGGRARPPSHGTAVALVFSSLPRAPRAGPLGQVQVSVVDSVGQPVAGVESTTVTVALGAHPGGGTLRGKSAPRP